MAKDLKNISAKRVLVRCDFDVPLKQLIINNKQEIKVRIIDDSRLKTCLPTIQYLIKKQAGQIILAGHLGRPDGMTVKNLSLFPVAKRLEKLLAENTKYTSKSDQHMAGVTQNTHKFKIQNSKFKIHFIKDIDRYFSRKIQELVKSSASRIIMLENLRFSGREEANCGRFAKNLSRIADVYVNESFAASHRAHSSIDAIQNYLPSYLGFHTQKEIENLSAVLDDQQKPLALIVGGAKIETKLPLINLFLNRADCILIGGAVANNFLKASGHDIGGSLVDDSFLATAKRMLALSGKTAGPQNFKDKRKIQTSNARLILPVDWKMEGSRIFDIGPRTIKLFGGIIQTAKTIIWNGPMGRSEIVKFKTGTAVVAKLILESGARTVIAGGDTGLVLRGKKIPANIFISSGGGAALEFLSGKRLPGIR